MSIGLGHVVTNLFLSGSHIRPPGGGKNANYIYIHGPQRKTGAEQKSLPFSLANRTLFIDNNKPLNFLRAEKIKELSNLPTEWAHHQKGLCNVFNI